jgi:MFS family permease
MVEGEWTDTTLIHKQSHIDTTLGFFASAGWEEGSEREATVGLWTGNLVSVFFITQFFTSLLWSSIADRHGRRAVIVASLAVSSSARELAVACVLTVSGQRHSSHYLRYIREREYKP